MSDLLFFVNHLRAGAGMIHRVMGFSRELKESGRSVEILGYFEAETDWAEETGMKASSLYPCRYRWWLYEVWWAHPFTAFLLLIHLIRSRPKLVLVELHHEADWALFFRPLFGYKVLFTYHGVADSKFYEAAVAKDLQRIKKKTHRLLKRVDQVVVVSDFLKQEVATLGIDAERIYNGVEARFKPMPAFGKLAKQELLFVGRFAEYKGAINIVRAFVKVSQERPAATLKLYGFQESPSYLEQIRGIIRQHGLQDRCQINGPVSFNELPSLLSNCSVFVNGSVDETFGMPLIEAQACGTPVAAFAAGGIPEVVAHEKTGLLAQPNDISGMANNLLRLLGDEKFYESCQHHLEDHVKQFRYASLKVELDHVTKEMLS